MSIKSAAFWIKKLLSKRKAIKTTISLLLHDRKTVGLNL